MSFFLFALDSITVTRQRGRIPDDDLVTFAVFVDQLDRGHGAARFPALTTGSRASTSDRTVDGTLAYPAAHRFNMSERWWVGPIEVRPGERVAVVYTGVNTSDSQLDTIRTQAQDELELKILNYVARKYVELIAGVVFASDVASLLSDAFNEAFKNPVGALIGYRAQGPCNGPVFSDAVPYTGQELEALPYTPVPPANLRATPPLPTYTTSSFNRSYTDAATHDTSICGDIAETTIACSVMKASFVSIRWLLTDRFPSRYPTQYGPGLRQYGTPGTTISVKSMLGIRP